MNKELIDRINYLAKKSREEALTPQEIAEQKELRQLYLQQFRKNFRRQLENIEIVD